MLGTFRVYLKTPGTNAKGWSHSSYFIRGYAIHGYVDVPAFNASHGCLRVPIPDAWRIFSWMRIGDASSSTPERSASTWTPRETLVAELRRHALVIGEVTLTSGATAQYYVDAKRAILRPAGFARAGRAGRRATRASGRRPPSAGSRWAPTRPPAPRSPAAPT